MSKGFPTSGLLRHLKNEYNELYLDMKRPHEDNGLEIGNVKIKMTMLNSRLLRKLCQS